MVLRYRPRMRPPKARWMAPMVATLVAGPAIRKTKAAPVGMPPATREAAMGTDAVAQTYSGRLITSISSMVTTGPHSERDMIPSVLTHVEIAALIATPNTSHPQMERIRSSP